MSSSVLWAVDILGRVYTLSTTGQHWELCKDPQPEFKRVAAVRQCCWGLACDHQIYVHVPASDLPIRYQEETYENQRWNPVGGFCEKLLPSDRWQWSDVGGLRHQQLDSFQLPSPYWEWESDWYVDENIGGEPTEKGGWTYAVDFPATYLKDKKWNSCVRRRRWIRYRRYRARDTWAKIPSHEDSKQLLDPFNDIAVGGWEVTDEPVGHLSVWAVSLQGKVWYREEVWHDNPEGTSWSELVAPGEVVQISCGPNDLLWATLWEGQAIVREGINRNNPKGSSWTIVEPPTSENGIMYVSAGTNVLWAVTKDRKVSGVDLTFHRILFLTCLLNGALSLICLHRTEPSARCTDPNIFLQNENCHMQDVFNYPGISTAPEFCRIDASGQYIKCKIKIKDFCIVTPVRKCSDVELTLHQECGMQ